MVVDDTADKEDPAAAPTSEPDATANVKSAGEAGRIADSAGINGYDGTWCPTDKTYGADATGADFADDSGDNPGDNASDGAATRPATEAAGARPTDTEPSTGA